MLVSRTCPLVTIGPVMPGWGSWEWVGTFLLQCLDGPFRPASFEPWEVPDADVVVVVKHAPPLEWIDEVTRRSAVVWCPIDWYADVGQIEADRPWLNKCTTVVVHCRRLLTHFGSAIETRYLDHPLKFRTPTRQTFQPDGPLLWVGVRSNLTPLVEWVNANPLPRPLDVLTNPERTGSVPTPAALGFLDDRAVRIHEWTPDRHLTMTAAACAALDIKGTDFRSRHKPPAKALDFVASGLPLAMNSDSSSAEHLAALGLSVPTPLDTERWLSEGYWDETRRLGERLSRDLEASRLAERYRTVIADALDSRSARRGTGTVSKPPGSDRALDTVTTPTSQPASPRMPFRLYGLMITKDDESVLGDWCRDQLQFYDAVVCLDGSNGDATKRIATRFPDRLIYLHERDFVLPHKTDHGLRDVVHREIVRRFGPGHWIMCCHADEFCYHDPRKAVVEAIRGGFDQVSWFSPHFYPHPDEWADWERLKYLSIPDRYRHYHWSYLGDGFPWVEDRLYRDGPDVRWDGSTHGNVRPLGLTGPASFHPTLKHYKVLITDPAFYDVAAASAHYKTHWTTTSGRTGVPFPVRVPQDLFVSSVKNYSRCDRFDGSFPHPWNIGESYRPDLSAELADRPQMRYETARDLALSGNRAEARTALAALDADVPDAALRALVRNDLAVLATLAGDHTAAVAGLVKALELDPGCGVARANLVALSGEPSKTRSRGTEGSVTTSQPEPTRVRVAIVSLLFNWPSTGGGNVHSAELPMFLARAGYEVRHLYAKFDAWGLGRVTQPTPHPSQAIPFDSGEWTSAGIVEKFRTAIDAFDPDWVVLTDSWNMKPLLAHAAAGRKYVLRLQALECLCPLNNVRLLPGPSGKPEQCTRHQLATPDACASCVKIRGESSGDLHRAERALSGFGSPEYREAFFAAFAGASAVLAVNPLSAAMVEPFTNEVRVVTAGMDPARFPWPFPVDKLPARTPGRFRIVFAGLTQEWMKGFHVLQAASKRLWERRRDFEVVATDTPPEGGPEPWAVYIGWQSQDALPAQLAAADIVVVPTVAQEALGRTAVEAMAVGRPVVASRLGGLPFTVADGSTGLLCEPGDPVDLATKLSTLLDDETLRARMGNAGRQRFEAHYTWPAIVGKHYRPLFGDPAVRPGRAMAVEASPSRRDRPTTLVVISHYAGRSTAQLVRLLDSMADMPAGRSYALRVVVNCDNFETIELPERHRDADVLYRTNAGYNIGAWESGWRTAPIYSSYLFLQDECRVVRVGWLEAFARAAAVPGVGLVGECLSLAWDAPWDVLADRFRGHVLPEHGREREPTERVEFYLSFFLRNNIPPGTKGDHLQSLVLFANRSVLEQVGGFPESTGYGEAIAAEIGVCKKVQAAGLTLAQVAQEPFEYIEHPQWAHRRATSRQAQQRQW